jgi:protein-S-isoprenylcysteine O-methyltransferase Ste14
MSTVVDRPGPARPAAGGLQLGPLAGGVWFLLLALLYAKGLPALLDALPASGAPLAAHSFAAWAAVLSRGCTVVFMITQAWLMVVRPPAMAQTPGTGAMAIALAGTYGVWLVGFLPTATLSPPLAIVSAVLTLVGSALIVFTILHLGRSFSIVPQARDVVTRGPYALVRHPLYAAEEIALIGVAMHVVWYAALPFLIGHVALQLKRMAFEEKLLREVFPRYEAYAGRTARWVPGLW